MGMSLKLWNIYFQYNYNLTNITANACYSVDNYLKQRGDNAEIESHAKHK